MMPPRAGLRRALLRMVALALVALTALLCAPVAAAARATGAGGLVPSSGGPYFGPILDWTSDSAKAYRARLGATPAVYGQAVHYPLTAADDTYLTEFVQQVSSVGGLALLDVEPIAPLRALRTAQAAHLAGELRRLHRDYGTDFYVRFGAEMNGSWVTWGQQPAAYRAAFRTVARAVHSAVPRTTAAMVWAPAYGAGYPFTTAYGRVPKSGPSLGSQLDTNGDGKVTDADDAYAPYYPGDGYVDWVGLSIYDYGVGHRFGADVVPAPNRYLQQLQGKLGYSTPTGQGRDFVADYARGRHRPMMVETGALWDSQHTEGASELAIKQAWWRQVFSPSVQRAYPQIAMVAWLERRRPEAEVNNLPVDWRVAHTPQLADALLADIHRDHLSLGPVRPIHDLQQGNTATAQSAGTVEHGDELGWIVLCATILLGVYLLSGVVSRFVPSWRYPEQASGRDRRVDIFRGWIIIAVVVTHIEVAGIWEYICRNMIGAITGAEMFVLLSGVVLGMVYPAAVRRAGEWAAARAALRRAGNLYFTALGVILVVFALSHVSGPKTDIVTTFTDRGTGAGGAAAAGRVYDLYPNAAHLLDYPPPWYVVRDLLLLRIGPWPVNILGLFVVLSLAFPALMWLVRRRLWWVVLGVSWALYVVDRGLDARIFHAQFEDVFPLLTWQVAFCNGIVIGYYRKQIVDALSRGLGKVLVSAFVVVYCGGLGVLWLAHQGVLSVPGLTNRLYYDIAANGYVRIFLQPGRLIDLALMLVVAYAFLTAFWKPVAKAVGWLYEPLGQHSLYVFIMHVFFVIAVASIPSLNPSSAWEGTLVHTAVIAVLWTMVRTRFLFRVVPS